MRVRTIKYERAGIERLPDGQRQAGEDEQRGAVDGGEKAAIRSFGIYLSILVLKHVIHSAVAYYGDSI